MSNFFVFLSLLLLIFSLRSRTQQDPENRQECNRQEEILEVPNRDTKILQPSNIQIEQTIDGRVRGIVVETSRAELHNGDRGQENEANVEEHAIH